jgi:hypothetical protein
MAVLDQSTIDRICEMDLTGKQLVVISRGRRKDFEIRARIATVEGREGEGLVFHLQSGASQVVMGETDEDDPAPTASSATQVLVPLASAQGEQPSPRYLRGAVALDTGNVPLLTGELLIF